ncbi:MAG: glycoside hydrolase family 43 protein [Tannerellaceae bacterium]|nr:glycoside hydrolase family 43 protein [Tannerellaceae bacterium]
MKKKLFTACRKGLLLAGSACLLNACGTSGSGNSLIHAESVAYFDSFYYQGEDDYYKENPLPGADYFYNPVLSGWYSDPSICKNDKGDYFLVTSTFCYYPGVPIFHSRDLVNWQQIGYVLNRPEQLVNMEGQHVSGGIFAPDITYNPHNQTYHMVTTNVGAGNFFVKTKDPFAGEWSNPIPLPEVGGIDPSFFFDEDGKAYILNNDEPHVPVRYDGHRAIIVQEFDVNEDKTVGPRVVLLDGGVRPEENPIWIEGPHMYKINGHYYVMSAEGGTGPQHSEVILRGDHPIGPFTPWQKNPILTQRHLDPSRPDPVTCAGHADLVEDEDGQWWSVFLACRPIDNRFENLGRETFMMPVRWSEDGFPYITKGDESIPMIVRKPGVIRNEKTTFGNFQRKDDFSSDTLAQEWFTLRGPGKELWSLTGKPGYLALACSEISVADRSTPAFIGRPLHHHKFEAVTRLIFDPVTAGDAAGLLLFKDETHHYFLSVRKNQSGKIICLEKSLPDGYEVLAVSEIIPDSNPISLKITSHGTHYDFYYTSGSEEWNRLCTGVDAYFLSTTHAGGFTGTTIGLYAVKSSSVIIAD